MSRAEHRLSNRKYTFTFEIQRITIQPSNQKALEQLKTAKNIFADEGQSQRIQPNQIINYNLMQIQFNKRLPEDFLYADVNRQIVKIPIQVTRAVLSNIVPAEVSEEEEDIALDLLFDQSNSVYNGDSFNNNEIKILESKRNTGTLTLASLPSEPKFMVRYSTYVIWRECQALQTLALHPKKHHLPLLNLLLRSIDAKWGQVDTDLNVKYRVLTDSSKSGTEEQREFVRKALGTPDVAILEGPPGSGKTTTILEIILQLLTQRKRVLLVASTHVAVDNVLEKLMEKTTDNKTLIEKYGVVPIRVGGKDCISEKVQQYHIDNFIQSERRRLINFLSKQPKRSASQEMLYEALCDDSQGTTVVEDMALESANLVCGTTIGILQSKFIKESDQSKPAFDYLILDEASKTTFQEFLVPALHAARWILSGDIKQLSPYVDQVPIRENLANLTSFTDETGKEDKRVCVDVFNAATKRNKIGSGSLIVYEDRSDLPRRYEEQTKAVGKILTQRKNQPIQITTCMVKTQPGTIKEKLEVMGSNIVLAPKSQIKNLDTVFLAHLQSNQDISEEYKRRRAAFQNYLDQKGITDSYQSNQLWEEAIAWRISRLYELRDLKDRQTTYLDELQLLLPYFERADRLFSNPQNEDDSQNERPKITRADMVLREIRRIERIALPSVLELLQKGYKQSERFREETRIPLYDGLPKEVLKQRHTMLTYQHRMHPDISKFPRENIYQNEGLNDSHTIEESRSWNYRFYNNRNVWIHVNPARHERIEPFSRSNVNVLELKVIESHFNSFREWARNHPSQNISSEGYWTVALLSFYKGQANRLTDMMRALFGSKNRGYFESRTDNLKVEVCTVDRFQGHEADLVFLSLVNTRRKIGFLDNPNRLNVALTRAKYQLVIVGDRTTFGNHDKSTELLIKLEKTTPEGTIKFGE